MNIKDQFPSKYLKASDLDGDTTLTISHIEIEEMKTNGNVEDKLVVYFEENEQGLMLNKTNAVTIAKVLTDEETDNWIGKRITLFPTQVDFQGKQVEAIRIKIRLPKPAAKPAAAGAKRGGHRVAPPPPPVYDDGPPDYGPPTDDDIPF